jgi:probable HAF family extracellular repeat protein
VSTPSHAFRYDGTPGAGGIMRDLGTLGGLSSEAFAINDLGQVTGYAQSDPNGPNPGTYAFIYTGTPGAGGVMKSLGSLAGPGSTGIAINNAGQVAGTTPVAADGTTHAFRYDGAPGTGVMHDLGVSPGYAYGFAYGMNASGQVVGENDSADGNTAHAFIYKGTPGINGVMTDLLPLPGGTISSAAGVNDAGYVVGISDIADGLHFHPVLWRPDGSIVNLEQWLASVNPAAAANWDLSDPFITGISNTGLITGDAIYLGAGPDNGRDVAMILDASSLVPEPSCLLLLVSAPLMIRRKR